MGQQTFPPLSAEQITPFLPHGHVVIPDCFSREFAQNGTSAPFARLGCAPDDPSLWEKEMMHMPASERVPTLPGQRATAGDASDGA